MGDIIKGHPNTEIIHALEYNKLGRVSYSNNRILHIANKYPKHLISQMNLLKERKELCDVVIKVGQRVLHAHRVILSAASPYFYAMFTGKMLESRDAEITIHEISDGAIEQLINFIYTASIIIEESNVQTLLPAACLLQMVDIQEACCDFLKNQLDPTNCLGIRAFADTHSCRELLKIADQFTQNNFQEVIINEEFLLLPYAQLVEILSSDDLNVRNEEQVFKAVMAWVKFSLPERKPMLFEVLQYVRFPLINPKFLVGTVGSEVLVKEDEHCRDLVDEAKNYLLLPHERPMRQGPRTKPRKVMRRGEILFVAGGWCNGDAISSVEKYDPETNEWRMAAPMVKRRCGVGVAVLNELLYAVGGHDGQSYLNTIERYDPHMDVWSCDVAPTSTCRTSVGVAVLDNYLYAVGGQDGVSCLNLVERYNPTTNRWFKIASMKTRRLGVAVAVLGPYLYAVGGADGTMPLNTVERYDQTANKWTYMAPMGTRRKHLGVTIYNNHLYAVGGRDNTTELSSAERYNPQTNKWTPIVAMTSRRSGVGLAVVNGLLIAVGGFDGTAYLKTIEIYDPLLASWKLCGTMNYRRLGGGVGVVKVPPGLPCPDLTPHEASISQQQQQHLPEDVGGSNLAMAENSLSGAPRHPLPSLVECDGLLADLGLRGPSTLTPGTQTVNVPPNFIDNAHSNGPYYSTPMVHVCCVHHGFQCQVPRTTFEGTNYGPDDGSNDTEAHRCSLPTGDDGYGNSYGSRDRDGDVISLENVAPPSGTMGDGSPGSDVVENYSETVGSPSHG